LASPLPMLGTPQLLRDQRWVKMPPISKWRGWYRDADAGAAAIAVKRKVDTDSMSLPASAILACAHHFRNGSEARYETIMEVKRKPTALVLAGLYFAWELVGRPIWNLNVERVAEEGQFDTTLVEGAPVLEWAARALDYLPHSFPAGFVAGAIIFAYWDTWTAWFGLPSTKKVADPRVATEPPSPEKRVFVPRDITVVELKQFYENGTALEADGRTTKYIGKWMHVRGILRNVIKLRGGSLWVTLQVKGMRTIAGETQPGPYTFYAEFSEDNEELELARKGNLISFTGQIERIRYGGVEFTNCELTNVQSLEELADDKA
jgi:hypothetical protein